MALYQFVIHGVIEAEPEAVGMIGANSIAGSDDPSGGSFVPAMNLMGNPEGSLEIVLGGAVLSTFSKKFGSLDAAYWVHGYGASVTAIDLNGHKGR